MAKGVMRRFKLNEISAVDRPAQKGALMAIIKRDDSVGLYLGKAEGDADLPAAADAYIKRSFTQDQRDKASSSGAALPDGSFPIENRSDLGNAIRAFGRAKNPARAKAHIISRARALGATSSLPSDWNVGKMLQHLTNDAAVAGFQKSVDAFMKDQTDRGVSEDVALEKSKEFANALVTDLGDAVLALKAVSEEIDADPAIIDKKEALQETYSELIGHLKGITAGDEPGLLTEALAEAGFEIDSAGALVKRETQMGFDIRKSLGLPATATDADIEKAFAAKGAAPVIKINAGHLDYLAKAADPKKMKDGKAMPEEDCNKFLGMSDADRDAYIKANPLKKAAKADEGDDDADDSETMKVDGVTIRKSDVAPGVFEVLKSQQAAIEKAAETEAVAVFTKRATDSMPLIGKADEIASLLRSVQKSAGDAVAEAVAKKFEALNEVIKAGGGKIFKEVGGNAPGGSGFAKAADEIEAKAQALVTEKKAKNIFKARDMVRTDPANKELVKRESEERKAA